MVIFTTGTSFEPFRAMFDRSKRKFPVHETFHSPSRFGWCAALFPAHHKTVSAFVQVDQQAVLQTIVNTGDASDGMSRAAGVRRKISHPCQTHTHTNTHTISLACGRARMESVERRSTGRSVGRSVSNWHRTPGDRQLAPEPGG